MEKGSGKTGDLFILDSQGRVIHKVALPQAFGSPDWNGGLAAPTLADIDGDTDLEIVLNTAHSGFVAYDLPGTAGAVVSWGTGRGNMQRTGAVGSPAVLSDPVIHIRANGQETDSVVVSPDEPVVITVQLDSSDYAGRTAELWMLASTPFDWYSFVTPNGWRSGVGMYEKTTLHTFGPVELLRTPLPEGLYHFYFGVDLELLSLMYAVVSIAVLTPVSDLMSRYVPYLTGSKK